MVKKLLKTIKGKGALKDKTFKKVFENSLGYIYIVKSEDTKDYFEVFLKKTVAICIDFEKRIYSETDFKEKYPKEKDFGSWAWTAGTISHAKNILRIKTSND